MQLERATMSKLGLERKAMWPSLLTTQVRHPYSTSGPGLFPEVQLEDNGEFWRSDFRQEFRQSICLCHNFLGLKLCLNYSAKTPNFSLFG